MDGRVSLSIITLFCLFALIFPGVVSSGSPVLDTEGILRTIAYYGPLLFLLVILQRSELRPQRPAVLDILLVFGLLAFTFGVGLALPSSDESQLGLSPDAPPSIALLVVLAAVTASTEELFFRSWLLTRLPRLGLPGAAAAGFSVFAFAAAHAWQGVPAMVLAALSGAAYTAAYAYRRRIGPIIAAHILHNALALILLLGR